MQDNIFSFEGTDLQKKRKSGDNSGEATPVPISNTEVKLLSADDTWWEAAWESRTLPVFYYLDLYNRDKKLSTHKQLCAFFLFAASFEIQRRQSNLCIFFLPMAVSRITKCKIGKTKKVIRVSTAYFAWKCTVFPLFLQ